MGTNYYLRRTKPVLCFPEFHLGKKSAGWKGLFQASDYSDFEFIFETQKPPINSIADIREAVASGEWEIVDEYGEEVDVEEMIALMLNGWEWEQEKNMELSAHKDPNYRHLSVFLDPEGAEFTRGDFQ